MTSSTPSHGSVQHAYGANWVKVKLSSHLNTTFPERHRLCNSRPRGGLSDLNFGEYPPLPIHFSNSGVANHFKNIIRRTEKKKIYFSDVLQRTCTPLKQNGRLSGVGRTVLTFSVLWITKLQSSGPEAVRLPFLLENEMGEIGTFSRMGSVIPQFNSSVRPPNSDFLH
jgi:hypothetical protein